MGKKKRSKRSSRKKRRGTGLGRKVLFIAGVLALVGLIVGLVIGLAGSGEDDAGAGGDDDGGGLAAGLEFMFQYISTGGNHTCGLTWANTPVCWGDNQFGQSNAPNVLMSNISAGSNHTCGIVQSDSTANCWGDNSVNQARPPPDAFKDISAGGVLSCGVTQDGTALVCWGSRAFRKYITDMGDDFIGSTLSRVSAGHDHACVLSDTFAVFCDGNDAYGQTRPRQVVGPWYSVSAGQDHTCVTGSQPRGEIYCFGFNRYGQGRPPRNEDWLSVSSGSQHSCGITNRNQLECWGASEDGRTAVPLEFAVVGSAIFENAASGYKHSCARMDNSRVVCFGNNAFGQTNIPSLFWTKTAVGDKHACALRSDGLFCFGDDLAGQATVPNGLPQVKDLSLGSSHTCAILADNTVRCWGLSVSGQADPPTGTFLSVSAAGQSTCGVRSDGVAVCWGRMPSPPSGNNFAKVSIGGSHGCLLVSGTGSIQCWGRNDENQVSLAPTDVGWSQLSLGTLHSCAVHSSTRIHCWGDNTHGQTDVQSLLQRSDVPPAAISGDLNKGWLSVSTKHLHSCGVRLNLGQRWGLCWGSASLGRTSVPLGHQMDQISAGAHMSCAITASAGMLCWGAETVNGQYGKEPNF